MVLNYVHAYIGIGSNLKNPQQQVTHAVAALAMLPKSRRLKISPWYTSRAIGPGIQPDYSNGAAFIETALSAHELLDQLQKIEQQHGRERSIRWGPRTLDLDILLFDDQIINTNRLTVPHPRIRERNFVATPLADLNPAIELPAQTIENTLFASINIAILASQLGSDGLTLSTTE